MRRLLSGHRGLRRGVLAVVVLAAGATTVLTASYALSEGNQQQDAGTQATLAQQTQPSPRRTPPPLPPRKQQIQDQYDTLRNASRATPPPLSAIPSPPPFTGEAWPQGIIQDAQAPYPQALYIIANLYQLDRGTNHIQVYAGADREDPSQGLVIVRVTPFDLRSATTDVYRTPTRAGTLRVVSAAGDRVTLTSTSGATFVFDIATRRFV